MMLAAGTVSIKVYGPGETVIQEITGLSPGTTYYLTHDGEKYVAKELGPVVKTAVQGVVQ
jgi:hypothetical protein